MTWAASLAGCSPSFILDFSASINPLGPPESALAAIAANLSNLRHYPDPGYAALRQALAQAHGIDPHWVLPGNGSAELLTWAGRELAAQDAVHLITPAFSDYGRALRAFGATVVGRELEMETLRQEGDGLGLGIETCLAPSEHRETARIGLLLNNPHNPTGCLFTAESLRRLLGRSPLVVVDEAFMDFVPPSQQQSLIPWVAEYPNLVVLRSLTKFYSLPGLRLGYAIAHPDRLRRWQGWRDPWSVNSLSEAATLAVLKDTDFQQRTWNWLPDARSALFRGLQHLPGLCPFPGAANYLLVQSDRSTVTLQHQLLQQHRILIRDCMSFPELGDRFFRIAVRTNAENQRLLNALANELGQEGAA